MHFALPLVRIHNSFIMISQLCPWNWTLTLKTESEFISFLKFIEGKFQTKTLDQFTTMLRGRFYFVCLHLFIVVLYGPIIRGVSLHSTGASLTFPDGPISALIYGLFRWIYSHCCMMTSWDLITLWSGTSWNNTGWTQWVILPMYFYWMVLPLFQS